MPSDSVQAVVLCEDLQSWVFIYRLLIDMKFERRRIRCIPFPSDGQGSGEQFVRTRYPTELSAFRTQAARASTVLVVHTDADYLSVSERLRCLEQERERLNAEGRSRGGKNEIASRGPKEAVAILVPKWNIETWIHCLLDGVPVDEDLHYPRYRGEEYRAWGPAKRFAEAVLRDSTLAYAPPSMIAGIAEAKRLL